MLVQNDALVVGGTFVTAGEQTVNRIARWNGAEWSGFGPGLNGGVLDLIEFEGDLIACGGFTRPVGQPTVLDRVARWDGSAWVPMGAGFNARVNDLEIVDGVLYAGGPFTMSGDEPVSKLARWNAATQSWEEAIGIIDGEVKALRAVPDFNPGIDTLAFGGNFTSINGSAANGVVILDPAGGWMNILAPGNHDIEALAISKVVTGVRIFGLSVDYARVLMFGGLFDSDGMTNLGALRYDNVPELIPLGASGPDGRVRAIEVFNTLPPEFAFDGDDYARSVEGGYYDDVVLIGGDFASVGGVAAARVARFDGDGWAPLGGGVSDFVGVITVFDGEVWAGGEFTEADGWPASKLARWTLDAPPPPVCQGDVNGDGVVNFSDLNAVLTDFGATGSGIPGDVNGDGVVNFADLNTVLTNFGFVCE
jgi:hypothetical protein